MTIRMIMILLYGAGGEPGKGEIPMNTVQHIVTQVFPVRQKPPQGALRTNTADIYIAVFKSSYEIHKEGGKAKCQTVKPLLSAIRKAAQAKRPQRSIWVSGLHDSARRYSL